MSDLMQQPQDGDSMAQRVNLALIQGDLSKLSEPERLKYYHTVCASVGLNPSTKPFGYLSFQGKLTLYATRNCTDQLRAIYGVSLIAHEIKEVSGVLYCTVSMRDRHGRTDTDMGCVTVKGLSGDALANAWMKALTKAKRRCTLSLCGLSSLDESEIETVQGATPVEPETVRVLEECSPKKEGKPEKLVENARKREKLMAEFVEMFSKAKEMGTLPNDWKQFIRSQYGVTVLKEASATQLGHLIDWIAVYLIPNEEEGQES